MKFRKRNLGSSSDRVERRWFDDRERNQKRRKKREPERTRALAAGEKR